MVDETPISLNGQEVGVVDKPPPPAPEPVREIDDIDDLDVGVSEDLLRAGRLRGVVITPTTETVAKAPQSKVAARDKFRSCENCSSVIEDRILVCSGCKKVAYCNRQCQKKNWKMHKKSCSHKVNKEDCTG